jgi:hypothetical protein
MLRILNITTAGGNAFPEVFSNLMTDFAGRAVKAIRVLDRPIYRGL